MTGTGKFKPAATLLAIAALAACGGNKSGAAENSADTLRSAAEQSTPEAREVLMNEAARIEEQNMQAPAGAQVQQALQNAGNAQAGTAPPPLQAQPRRPGDPAPPPKTLPQP